MQEQEKLQATEDRKILLNKLASAPSDSIFQLKMKNLYFDEFPDISRFKNITAIDAERNLFKSIKKTAFVSDSLKRINLEFNKLKHIHFPKNTSVKNLVLNGNDFKRIPRSIKNLQNLQNLEITNNHIKRIPRFLKK